ncbi:hypothetical protein OR573_14875 [Halomonas sp. CH40]
MSPSQIPVLLAGAAVFFGLISLVLFYRVVIKPRQAAKQPEEAVTPPPATPEAPSRQKTAAKPKARAEQCLFVVFEQPSQAINQALGKMLKDRNAFYEDALGAFHLPPGPHGYPLMVASATSPGKLPPLHKEGEHPPVKGVSILIRFLNAHKVSRNPDDLIAFTHDVAALGGQMLDARQQPITPEKLAEMRREND